MPHDPLEPIRMAQEENARKPDHYQHTQLDPIHQVLALLACHLSASGEIGVHDHSALGDRESEKELVELALG